MPSGTWDRHRGHEDSYDVVDIGFNFRLDEPRAALGLSRLPQAAAGVERRGSGARPRRRSSREHAPPPPTAQRAAPPPLAPPPPPHTTLERVNRISQAVGAALA